MASNYTITDEELQLIEQFLTGELQGDERRRFETELSGSIVLQKKTAEVRLLLQGINEASLREELPGFHAGLVPVKELYPTMKRRSFTKWLMVAASVVIVVTLGLWYWTNAEPYAKLYAAYFTPDPGLATVMGATTAYEFDKAMVEYKEGAYDKALAAWNGLLMKDPASDTLLYFTGVSYQAKKEYEMAISNLTKVIAYKDGAFYKDACWYLGLCYLATGVSHEAVKYIRLSDYPQSEALLKKISR